MKSLFVFCSYPFEILLKSCLKCLITIDYLFWQKSKLIGTFAFFIKRGMKQKADQIFVAGRLTNFSVSLKNSKRNVS